MQCDEKQLRYGRQIVSDARLVRPAAPAAQQVLTVQNTVYAVYLGQTAGAVTATAIRGAVTVAGGGALSAQVGLFSSPAAPSFAPQTLTKVFAAAVATSLTTTGNKALAAGAVAIARDVHVWAVIRTAMGGAEPTFYAVSADCGSAAVMTAPALPALTSITTISTFTVPATSVAGSAPYLMLQLA
jgi:hypothetical protein